MKTLVCIDRDGTLIYDDKYYLGSQEDWQELVELLPGVVEGVQRLRELEDQGLYMITNQSGVAIKDYDRLTEERANTVCREVMDRLEDRGAGLDGYFLCPHVPPEYAERKDVSMNADMVCDCDCIKPRLGMVFDALSSEGVTRDSVDLYVIGDRASDVETAVKAGGTGILVPFENEPGQEEEVSERFDRNAYIADSLVDAAHIIHDLQ